MKAVVFHGIGGIRLDEVPETGLARTFDPGAPARVEAAPMRAA